MRVRASVRSGGHEVMDIEKLHCNRHPFPELKLYGRNALENSLRKYHLTLVIFCELLIFSLPSLKR